MYTEHFGLATEPFSLTPDPAFLYLSPQHREALAAVQYGLLDGRGFITLIGEVGTGKTTLLYSILGRRLPELDAAYVSYSTQSFEDLLATALRDLGIAVPADQSKRAMLDTLNQLLLKRADEGRTTALIIDEAQNLSDETFEDLRLLSNFETYTRKLLQIVLVGQPELQDRLQQPRLRQLRERVSVRAYVNPLSREEMERYIAHRLERAGGSADLFTPAALRAIVRRTVGIPRRANILCHNALLFAYGRDLARVARAEAREAIAEMLERRPGRIPRGALRRLRLDGGVWGWGLSLAGALAVGAIAGQLWSFPEASHSIASSAIGREALAAPDAARNETDAEPAPEPVAAAAAPASEAAAPSVPEPETVDVVAKADARPAEMPEEAVVADEPSPTPAEPDARAVVVPRGATAWELLTKEYGSLSPARRERLYERLQQLNPQLKDVNVIIAGERLLLPTPVREGGR